MLYHDLTGDASLANDKISKEMEERLRLMMLLEDSSIIIDLRTNNGFQGSKFDIFWDELNRYFNEVINNFQFVFSNIPNNKIYYFFNYILAQ